MKNKDNVVDITTAKKKKTPAKTLAELNMESTEDKVRRMLQEIILYNAENKKREEEDRAKKNKSVLRSNKLKY
jgi:hypothetical protein